MSKTKVYKVRAVHHDGVLKLLDPLELPEGAQVRLSVRFTPPDRVKETPKDETSATRLVYPTRLVPAERLDRLANVVEVGGDALVDSEALYDANRH
jgi:predicted DNA-binding antitoxin AbrB/MazE fold protein